MCAGPEPGAGPVAGAGVERHAEHRDVGALDLVEPGQPGERRRAGEARDQGRVDRAAGVGCEAHHNTFERNDWVRACWGRSKTSAGGPCSTTTPPSMKTTRSQTSRAKPISWVTTIIVIPSAAEPLHHVEHLPDQLGVERRGGLVEEHQRRLHRQRPGDRDPLLLAAREGAGVLVGALGEPDPLEQGQRLLAGLGLVAALDEDRRLHDVLERGAVREQVEPLEDHADVAPGGGDLARAQLVLLAVGAAVADELSR